MYPASGHSESLQVFNKRQSTVSEKLGIPKKFDTSVDRKLANDGDYTSIFSKVIGCELSYISSNNPYLRCWVNFMSNAVGTKVPHFVDLGLPTGNTSDKVDIFGTPLPESEGRRMDPIGMCQIMFLAKLQRLE